MNNRVTHFEIPSDNPGKAMGSFKEAFGWDFQQFGTEPYRIAIHGEWEIRKQGSQVKPPCLSIDILTSYLVEVRII
jgi:predicted enzyme related to lactoylglutathione lyase